MSAKYARLRAARLNADERQAWAAIEALVARLARADHVVLSTPVWSFSIPYRLKHWIDLITQPGLTFSFDPATGYAPLLRARPTLAIIASAGDYTTGESRGHPDLATPYLRAALGFIGLVDPIVVSVSPTLGRAAQAATTASLQRLTILAHDFIRRPS